MRRTLLSSVPVIFLASLLAVASNGCGGGGGGGGGGADAGGGGGADAGPTPDAGAGGADAGEVPDAGGGADAGAPDAGATAGFSSLVDQANSEEKALNSKSFAFGQAWNSYLGTEPTTGADALAKAQAYISSGGDFVSSLSSYDTAIAKYLEPVTAASSSTTLKQFQSVDPLLVKQVGGNIATARAGVAACQQQFPDVESPEFQQCLNTLRQKQIAAAAQTGMSAIVGSGAGVIVGGAAAAASAPVLVVVGATVVTGLVVGFVFDFCTASSSGKLTLFPISQQAAGEQCQFVSCESTIRQLPDGRRVATCNVPQGTGTLTIHPPGGAPIVKDLNVGSTGTTVDLSGCDLAKDAASPQDAAACTNTSPVTPGATATATACGDVSSVTASPNPASPAAGQAVTVTATTFPVVAGCQMTFSVVGTDGFTKTETPTTNQNGSASIVIPGASTGVVDTVDIGVGNVHRNVVYVFGGGSTTGAASTARAITRRQ